MFGQKNREWGKKHANDWFHDEYAQKKKSVKRPLKRFQKSKKENTENSETYVSERKEYKQGRKPSLTEQE